ncbi:MAG TPA: hemerythrin domain-containing protein [Candidatus Dormibacteraeota bacterium]|nr:hemerythrin domain-containing protein [Candidatus Dormibacteraeota bacterium]
MPTRADATTVLIQDHRTVDELFKRFEKTTERAHTARRELVDSMIRELSVHAAIEEQVFYPRCKAKGKEIKDEILEALEEHHVMKEVLAELEGMPVEHERFGARVTVLIELTRHHVEEEEGELFPHVRKAFSRDELVEMAEELEAVRAVAPTRPHPNAPDEPPANLANLGAAAVDRTRDLGDQAVETVGKVVREVRSGAGKSRR